MFLFIFFLFILTAWHPGALHCAVEHLINLLSFTSLCYPSYPPTSHPPTPSFPFPDTPLHASQSFLPYISLLYLLARSHPAGSVGIRAAQGTLMGESDLVLSLFFFFCGKNSIAEGGFCQSAYIGGQVGLHMLSHLTGEGWWEGLGGLLKFHRKWVLILKQMHTVQ